MKILLSLYIFAMLAISIFINETHAKSLTIDQKEPINEAEIVENLDVKSVANLLSQDNELDKNSIQDETNLIQDQNVTDENRLQREQYAKQMISYMNQSVDPCDDFYEYACGNWKNTLIKRNTHKRRDAVVDIDFDLDDKVEVLLDNPAKELQEKFEVELKQSRTLYKSCLKADLKKLSKSNDYVEAIKNISGFPAIDDTWNSAEFDWFQTNAKLSHYGVNALTNEAIVPQYPFPPYFKLIELGFDEVIRNDSVNNKTMPNYVSNEEIMREYLTTYGVVEPKLTEVISSIFEFWQAVLNVTVDFDNKYDCRELGNTKNITKWEKFEEYFEIAWNGLEHEHDISDCPCPYFYTKLDEICDERKEAVANYLALKFLHQMDARLSNAAFQKDYCNRKVKTAMQFLIDQLFMTEYFDPSVSDELTLMTKELRSSLRESLATVDWLDDETRKEALLKESTMHLRIGRYENNELMDQLIREIQNLNLSDTNYEKNNVEITKFMQYMKRYNGLHYKDLAEDTKPLQMLIGMQANGYYFNVDNSINMMVGLLQPPAYHKSWPTALKYGALGYLIGHELTHGFDTVGALFDGKGEERSWYTEKADESFQNLTKCYIEMFGEYEVGEIHRHIDGENTKDENIADHGGLRHALIAYRRHMAEILDKKIEEADVFVTKEDYMPGLDMKPEQLFYLGFAQLWCAAYTEENYWQELKDEHTIDKYRVLGAVSNTKEFAEAYKCPVGSKMNPDRKKCKLW